MKKESVAFRIFIIASITIMLLVPLLMIQSLVDERQKYRHEAIGEIKKSWAGSQTVAGPVLTAIKKTEKQDKDGNKYMVEHRTNYLPDELVIYVNVQPEIRYKGIYETVLYKAKIKRFSDPRYPDSPFPGG